MVKCPSLSSTYLTVKLERLTRKQSRQMINGSCWINLVYFSVSGGHMPCRMSLFSLGQKASGAVPFLPVCRQAIGEETANRGREQPPADGFPVRVIPAHLVLPTQEPV